MNPRFFAVMLGVILVVAFSGCLGENEANNEGAANLADNSGNDSANTAAKESPEIMPENKDDLPLNGEIPEQNIEEIQEPSAAEIIPDLINETDSVEIGEMI